MLGLLVSLHYYAKSLAMFSVINAQLSTISFKTFSRYEQIHLFISTHDDNLRGKPRSIYTDGNKDIWNQANAAAKDETLAKVPDFVKWITYYATFRYEGYAKLS